MGFNYDNTKADNMVGKHVLVSINRLGVNEELLSSKEIHGVILSVTMTDGLVVSQRDGSEFTLPPMLDCYFSAAEGVYTLKSTGEEIDKPDYLATFTVAATEEDS